MKTIALIAIFAAMSAYADKWEETLDAPQSGDRVVLNDHEYVLFSSADFSMLTNKMSVLVSLARKQWNNQHKTEEGRREWHGSKCMTTFTTNDAGRLVKVIEYADGYKHVEESEIRIRAKPPEVSRRQEIRREIRKNDIPRRLREAREGVNVTKEVK